jgi:Carboxypeptidase regulatory-like domain
MKSLITVATNPFVKSLEHCSYVNGVKFLDDTTNRFDANNAGGLYTAKLTMLKTNKELYKSGVVQLQKGDQKSATNFVDKNTNIVNTTGHRLYNKIQDVFGLNTSKLMEFFPSGKAGLNAASRGYIPVLIKIWNIKAATYHTELGTEWVAEIAALNDTWNTGVKDQSGEKSAVKKGTTSTSDITVTVAQNLWDLYLLVQTNNQPHAENVINTFFDTTPLNPKNHTDTDGLGRCLGIVKDAEGYVISAAKVDIINNNNEVIWTGGTNKTGHFRTPSLAIGMYHVRFEKNKYITKTISYEIQDGADIEVSIELLASLVG